MTLSPAHRAIDMDDVSELKKLLDQGADVQDPDAYGTTLLHHAVDTEGDGAMQTGDPLHVDMTALLLARGADPQAKDSQGQTPLDWAVALKHWLAEDLLVAWMSRH
jgi:ankyrin repeat protein